jgi:hypothetical protein
MTRSITDETKEKIRKLRITYGLSVAVLSERFSIGDATIRDILGMARPHRITGQETLDRAFEMLSAAAASGDRCPMNDVLPGAAKSVSRLAREGKIFVEVYLHNFRRVIILDGPQKGKATAASPPHRGRASKPYVTVGMEGRRYHDASRQASA